MDIMETIKRAILHQRNGDLPSARKLYIKVLEKDPFQSDSLHLLGLIDLEENDIPTAIQRIRCAIEQDPVQAIFYNSLGNAYRADGRTETAMRCYEKALDLRPDYALAKYNLALSHQENRQWERSIACYEKALEMDSSLYQAHNNLGLCFKELGRDEAALDHFRKAIDLRPGDTDAYNNMAATLEGLNRLKEAAAYVHQSLKLDPDSFFANLNQAQILYRLNRLDESRTLLRSLLCRSAPEELMAKAYTLNGFVEDKLGHYDEAYEAFEAGNRCERHGIEAKQLKEKGRAYHGHIDQIIALCRSDELEDQSRPPHSSSRAKLAFLVGFPRSGTTLMEQILNVHSNVVVLDERPVLDGLIRASANQESMVLRLCRGERDAVEQLRTDYLHHIHFDHISCDNQHLVVDKLPLNIINLPIIQRCFPEAKVIVALRHPLDCILSNYMQRFRLNASMINFLTLEKSALFYQKVMGFYLAFRRLFLRSRFEIKYEELVENLAEKTKELMAFLDLPWEELQLRYHEKARARNINTPSYSQVTQPIYRSSVYRWQHYESHLSPIIPMVLPYIDAFNYDGPINDKHFATSHG